MRWGKDRESEVAQITREDGLAAGALAWLVQSVVRVVVWFFRHPRFTALLVVIVLIGQAARRVGDWLGYSSIAVALGSVLLWRFCAAAHFRAHVTLRIRAWWRMRRIYAHRWQPAMLTCGLAYIHQGDEHLPAVRTIASDDFGDVLVVQMLPGQRIADYQAAADALAQSFGALGCRARAVARKPQWVRLEFLTADRLTTEVAMFQPESDADSRAVAVAVCEDGTTWSLPLIGSHWLIGGATGSGKGSVLWSLINGLTPMVRAGKASLWVIDPKGGVELAPGAPLFARFVYADAPSTLDAQAAAAAWGEQVAGLLEDAVTIMQRRLGAMRGHSRLHVPTETEPHLVVVIDEVLALTSFVTDRALKTRITTSLSMLLTQGRAAAVSMVLATQDARKEVLWMRDLIPGRIALRTTEASQADLILGDGAHERGAHTDAIPPSLPGIGYVQTDGAPEPVRVRFTHVTDDDITHVIVPRGLPGGDAGVSPVGPVTDEMPPDPSLDLRRAA